MDDRIPVAWIRGSRDPEKVKAQLKSAEDVLEILDEIIQKKKLEASGGCKPDFIDAGWPYRAADLNGYLRALNELQNLIPKS